MTNSYEFPPEHWDKIQAACAPHMGPIALAIVAGSRVPNQSGIVHTLPKSDTDVVLFTERIRRPTSLTKVIRSEQGTPHQYDLILRDFAGTLPWDYNRDREIGRGTISQMISTGQIVFDPNNIGARVQDEARSYYQEGPLAIKYDSMIECQTKLRHDVANNMSKSEEHRLIAGLVILQNIARAVLRIRKQWTSKGKILARMFNHYGALDINEQLYQAFLNYQKGEARPFHNILNLFSKWHIRDDANAVPYHKEFTDEPLFLNWHDAAAAAFTNARQNPKTLKKYAASHKAVQIYGVDLYLTCRVENSIRAVSKDRIPKADHEYVYAVARLVDDILFMSALYWHLNKTQCTLESLIQSALCPTRLPGLAPYTRNALGGEPDDLVAMAGSFLGKLVQNKSSLLSMPRTAPEYFRLE